MTAELAAAVRWVQLAGAFALVGACAFPLLVAWPAARTAGLETPGVLAPLDRRLAVLARWSLAAAIAGGVFDLWRQTALATGTDLRDSLTPAAFAAVLLDTRYGTVWLARHGLLALLGVLILVEEPPRDGRDWLACRAQALALAAASLALLGTAGHAASAPRPPELATAIHAAHLLTGGVWAGGLLALALALRWDQASPATAAPVVARAAARRFSALAVGAVGSVVVTGLYQAVVQVGGFPALIGTAYGRWLGFKLGLVALMLGVAGLNRRLVARRLGAAVSGTPLERRPTDRFRRQLLAEAALGAAILAVAGVLGLTTPARHAPVTWLFAFRLSWEATRDLSGFQTRVAVGSQIALLGLLAILLALLVPAHRWRWVLAAGAASLLVGLAVAVPPLAVDAYPTTYLRPAVPYTAASIAEGLALYRTHCAGCHGIDGRGDGPAAAGLRPRAADLTAKQMAHRTAGDIFWRLSHGLPGSAMGGFADRTGPDARWDLVNLLRALAAGEEARALTPAGDSRARLAAPDFTFSRGLNDEHSLKEYRGARAVVLVLFTLPGSADRLSRLQAVYPELVRAGAALIAVPTTGARSVYRELGDRLVTFLITADGATEAALAYGLFARDPAPAGASPPPPPSHVEFLIDRQGYLRARWIPRQGDGWDDPRRLLAVVERLATERPDAPPPADHVH